MQFNKQTYKKAETAPFDYELCNIEERPGIGDIVKDARGKKWQVIQTREYGSYYDVDDYCKTRFGEGFRSVRGKSCLIIVQEYYPKGSPEYNLYRLSYNSYSIRIA